VTTTDMSLDWLLGPQLQAFREAGFEVLGASAPGPHVPAIEARGIGHLPLAHATRAMAPGQDVRSLGELYRLFRALRPDIVHTHNPKPGLYGRVAARAARVPVVINTVHGLYALPDDPWSRRALVYALERLAATCSQRELVQNVEDLAVLRHLRVPERRLTLLGNGIDLTRFDPASIDAARVAAIRTAWGVDVDAVVCGVVGRLVWEKGLREVFDAARRLRTRVRGLRVVVVGPADPDKADAVGDAERRVAEADGVVFAGRRDDMADVYAAFDLYVLASHREGFPRSAMEAAAMAKPVVATDIRGCRQVVDHERTGLLVPVRSPAALADAIADLALDGARRVSFGQAGRQKAIEEFDQQRVIDRTLAAYRQLLNGPPTG
jgi:glycosyltransferase involved in cell wall biosynthesis